MNADACDHEHRGQALLPYARAVTLLLESARPCGGEGERVALAAALGRVLAAPVALDRDEPPLARSAMDGYALRSGDGAAPRRRREEAVYAGGAPPPALQPGEAMAVMTGGSLPGAADAVVPVERTRVDPGSGLLHLADPVQAGQHVRQAGEMGRAGRVLLAAGRVLALPDLVAAAGCGADPLWLARRPRVTVLSTGDEVVPWTERPGAHQVRDSNRLGALLQLARCGADPRDGGRVPDQPAALEAALAAALEHSDLVVTIGGVSMGAKDHLPQVFAALGVERLFHGVAIQPGKPLWAGQRAGRWVLGLPGNPVSAFVILELFGVPLVQRLAGASPRVPRPLLAGCAAAPARARGRERFLPADLQVSAAGEAELRPRPEHGSGDWTSLAGAQALLRLAPGASVAPGDPVSFLPL